jgi:hypothetical protein
MKTPTVLLWRLFSDALRYQADIVGTGNARRYWRRRVTDIGWLLRKRSDLSEDERQCVKTVVTKRRAA